MIILIILAVMLIGLFIGNLMAPKIQFKKSFQELKNYFESNNNFKILSIQSNNSDFIVERNDNKKFYIKLIVMPNYSEIQINSKATWEVKYGAGNTVGKAQPKKRYLNEVRDFMNTTINDSDQKIVIFTPDPKKIVKYINECEIVFVKSSTDVYGAKIYSLNKKDLFNKL